MEHSPANKTILIVDDTASVRRLVVLICRGEGYRTLEAGSGEEALQVAERSGYAIDLLVTDVNMPGVSGIELARRLVSRIPALPVCFLSGRDLPSDAYADAGVQAATAFLAKPFDVDDLIATLRSLTDRPEEPRVRECAPAPFAGVKTGLVSDESAEAVAASGSL